MYPAIPRTSQVSSILYAMVPCRYMWRISFLYPRLLMALVYATLVRPTWIIRAVAASGAICRSRPAKGLPSGVGRCRLRTNSERENMGKSRLQFGPALKAEFIDRPNRFLVRCKLRGRGVIEAFMPNPGRMWELLFPGVTLFVKPDAGSSAKSGAKRRTQFTVLAVQRDGVPVFLHTHLNNHVARHLVETGQIPGLRRAKIIRAECPAGNHRFDFLIRQAGHECFLEVKSCTLFANGVAMFPDAVTQRGRRHLVELAAHSRPGAKSVVLVLVHTHSVDWFLPDYHTDLAFSQTLLEVHNDLRFIPVAIQWADDLSLTGSVKMLKVPWKYVSREARDRGAYLAIMRLETQRRLAIGHLGELTFAPGYYVYVGSAMQNLTARLARHARRRKRQHWHIDYLRQHASEFVPLPIRSSERQECDIARAMADRFSAGPIGFGCSDCGCPTHLFRLPDHPLRNASFHHLLQHFRMAPPT